jgi:hypothetical protein
MHSVPENLQASSNTTRSPGSVFISYSRKDYYFAESLTFALIQRDVAAWLDVKELRPGVDWEQRLESAIDTASHLVLVASPDSLCSPHVAAEWKRALARGIPVIVAHLRGNNVPPELTAMPRVNFHSRFRPAVDSLVTRLTEQSDRAPEKSQLWPLPPIVGITGLLLLLMVGLTMILADWGDIGSGAAVGKPLTIVELAILFGTVGFFVWHTSIVYLRRRMGMTRLAVILGYFVFAYGYPVLQHFKVLDLPAIFPDATMKVMGTVWPIAVTFSITSVVWLCILAFWRPSDLYRWSPTGKAWNTYRTKLLVTSEHEGLNSLGTVGRFQILNDPVDKPFAQRIQEELTARGGQKVDAAKESTRIVLVLSNRTQLAWLDALETNLRDKDLLTVVVTAIGLSPTLAWLWKRQWIDFRRCASAGDSKQQSTIPVPEALDRARLPLRPALAHHLLCSMAGLGLVAANIVAEAQQSDIDTLGFFTGISTYLLLWLAWSFASRRVSQNPFNNWMVVGWSALTLLSFVQFIRYFHLKGFSPRIIPAAIFLMAAPFVATRWRSGLAFWFPATSQRRGDRKKLLTPSRSWWTLLLSFLYGGGWMWLLGMIK